jgi:hypothetical protein
VRAAQVAAKPEGVQQAAAAISLFSPKQHARSRQGATQHHPLHRQRRLPHLLEESGQGQQAGRMLAPPWALIQGRQQACQAGGAPRRCPQSGVHCECARARPVPGTAPPARSSPSCCKQHARPRAFRHARRIAPCTLPTAFDDAESVTKHDDQNQTYKRHHHMHVWLW